MFCNTTLDMICKLQDWSHTPEQEDWARSVDYWFNGVLGGLIAVAGLITNSLTVFILCSMKDRNTRMNFLLCFLLMANNLFLATQLVNIFLYDFDYGALLITIPKIVYPLEKTTLTMSVFCTIGLAYEACLIIWDQERCGNMQSSSGDSFWRKRRAYSALTVLTAFAINLPRWFSYNLVSKEGGYKKEKTDLKRNFYYLVYYENFVLNVLTVFVPIALLVFFNLTVYSFLNEVEKEINLTQSAMQLNDIQVVSTGDKKKKDKRKLRSKTKALIIIIILFIICHFPRCILKFSDGFPKPFGIDLLETLGRVLQIVYASATPFIYLSQNKRFRKRLVDKLRCTGTSSDDNIHPSSKSVTTFKQ